MYQLNGHKEFIFRRDQSLTLQDFKDICGITGCINKRPWRGMEPHTCIVSGTEYADGKTIFRITHRPASFDSYLRDDEGVWRYIPVYTAADFNKFNFGTLVTDPRGYEVRFRRNDECRWTTLATSA